MASDKQPSAQSDAGAGQVQHKLDKWNEQGFRGVEVDPTPNENYTVAGVTSGAPTPETDVEAEAAGRKASGVGQGPLAQAEAEAAALADLPKRSESKADAKD